MTKQTEVPHEQNHVLISYLTAAGLVALTLWLRLAMDAYASNRPMLMLFFLPILLSSYFGGFGPGLLATSLSLLGADYFLIQPLHSFLTIGKSADLFQLVMLGLMGGLMCWLIEVKKQTAVKVANLAVQKHSEERFRKVMETLIEGCQIIGFDYRYRYLNPAAAAQGRQPRELLVGRTMMEIYPGMETTPLFAALKRCLEGRTVVELENESSYPDGTRSWFQLVIQPVEEGVFILSLDITERKRAETASRDSQALYHSLMDQMQAGFFRKDAAGRFTFVNPFYCRIKEMRAEDYLGKMPDETGPKHDPLLAAQGTKHHALIMTNGSTIEVEEEYTRQDGATVYFHAVKSPLYDSSGKIIGSQGMLFDITTRKLAEAQLLESNERFRQLAENIREVFWIHDCGKKQLVYVSPAYEMIWQQTCDSLYVSPVKWLEAVHPADRERIGQASKNKQTQGTYNEEYRINRPDGTVRWIHDQAVPIKDAAGEVVRVVGVAQDITERKQAAEAIQYERHLLRTVMDLLPDFIYVKDTEHRFLMVNALMAKYFGKESPGQMLGGSDADYFPAEAAARFRNTEAQVMAGHPLIKHESLVNFPNGQSRTLLTSKVPFRDGQGVVCGLVGFGYDITERKLIESELHQCDERFRRLIENASDMITTIDHTGVIGFASPSVERVMGYEPCEMTGKNTFDYIHPEDREKLAVNLQKILTNPQHKESVEYRFRHKNGEWRTIESIGRNLPDGMGGGGGVVVNSRDVTKSRSLEEQLRQSQKMEAIGKLAGGVAHDFNNILAVILLQTDLMEMEAGVTERQVSFGREINRAAQRAADLTRQLLLFSRRQVMQLVDCNLNDLVTNITKMLQRLIGEDIQMQIQFSPQALLIHADAVMVDQVLMNLAVNARDAMPHGGKLVIETSFVELDEAAIGQFCPGGRAGEHACLTVSDTGSGIPREILPRIFDPFFTTKDVGKGTGLGLATVFGIMQEHQGGVRVESEVGQGTTFRVYFPRIQPQFEPSPAGLKVARAIPGGTETILVVEDDPSLRQLMQSALTFFGYRVRSASKGAEALAAWAENREDIHLLLTDLVMPDGLNGIELARQLQQERPGLKVIYTSGYSDDVAGQDFPLHPGFDFLAKPFEIHQLAQIVRSRLDG